MTGILSVQRRGTDYIKHDAAILQTRLALIYCYLPVTVVGVHFSFLLLSLAPFHSWVLRPVEFARTQVEALTSDSIYGASNNASKILM